MNFFIYISNEQWYISIITNGNILHTNLWKLCILELELIGLFDVILIERVLNGEAHLPSKATIRTLRESIRLSIQIFFWIPCSILFKIFRYIPIFLSSIQRHKKYFKIRCLNSSKWNLHTFSIEQSLNGNATRYQY